MLNNSVIPLNLMTFVQMYMTSQLLQQVDFGFEGVQQYYYKGPETLTLSTGPPYDFDSPWDLCGFQGITPDIVTCHGDKPSKIWSHLGNNREFISLWKTDGLVTLDGNIAAVRRLYEERKNFSKLGFFTRHMKRWPLNERISNPLQYLVTHGRKRWDGRGTMEEELSFQLKWYEDRYIKMKSAISKSNSFDVHVTWTPYLLLGAERFWWILVFGFTPLSILLLIGCYLLCKECGKTRKQTSENITIEVKKTKSVQVLQLERSIQRNRERK